jgi:hypothetical protein
MRASLLKEEDGRESYQLEMHIGSFIGQEHVLGVNTAALKN